MEKQSIKPVSYDKRTLLTRIIAFGGFGGHIYCLLLFYNFNILPLYYFIITGNSFK